MYRIFVDPKVLTTSSLDHDERQRKRIAREGHKASENAQKLTGLRAKLYQKKRHHEKIQMKKQIKAHEERNVKSSAPAEPSNTPLPGYLLDRSNPTNAKALSSAIKQKRAEKAARFSVPLPKVKGISEQEMFKVVTTGKKTAKKSWKRMITKPTFVGPVSQLAELCEFILTYLLGLHSPACQVREIYKTYGSSIQERKCHTPRTWRYSAITYH